MANLTPPPSPAAKLRAMLAKDEIIVCPGVYDGFTARLALNAGFETLYMVPLPPFLFGSNIGGEMGKKKLIEGNVRDHASMIASISPSTPLIADADTGYGGPLMVGRTVASYINAGVAAFHIEDQVVNKRCGHLRNKELVDIDTWVSRIRAAVMAREQSGRDIIIIARTDALADHGYEEAMARLKAAVDVGADVAFLEGVRSIEEARRVCSDMSKVKRKDGGVGVSCLYNCVPGGVSPVLSVQEARECGYKMIITPTLALGEVFEAVTEAYKDLMEKGNTKGNEVPVRTLFETCGLKESVEFDLKAGGKLYEKGV
ncbi:related to carboxyphosphonoenolpyruvate phosphonomutase [Phialocephala subalpina]|uniref:Related to carboxyphosphonoenolpyruvate phosphonomutase n=1 Tax=Phialocephala subalpina TaxID=576137 RepID=A0A1L7WRC3_9HELO|nr:related to carboxyphosphonoenolpyruvate phosphonomutase [Phialocephala subalpina]